MPFPWPSTVQVQEMATPALTKFGSDELKSLFLTPSIKGDIA